MSQPRCRKKRCREVLIERKGPFGQLDFVCVSCETNAAGYCRRCPKPLQKTSKKAHPMYCPDCTRQREVQRDRNRYWNGGRRESDIERLRRRREDPVIYADMIQKQRARHRPKQPRTAFDRAYGRSYMKGRRAGAPRTTVNRRRQVAA